MKIKYVILDNIKPILFSMAQQHAEFARIGEPTSAGFCSICRDKETFEWTVNVWGESIGLKIKSDPNDERLIKRLIESTF